LPESFSIGPYPVVRLEQSLAKAGELFRFSWEMKGMRGVTRRLKVDLVASEYFRAGITGEKNFARREFLSIPALDSANPAEIERGNLAVVIPAGSMHSFFTEAPDDSIRAYSCRIDWYLRFRGDVAYWPDFVDTFEFVVLPE
jgi:hypothetical protein